jgi:hypothetical protein
VRGVLLFGLVLVLLSGVGFGSQYFIDPPGGSAAWSDPYVIISLDSYNTQLTLNLNHTTNTTNYEVTLT